MIRHLNKPLRKPSASPVTIVNASESVFLFDYLNIQISKKDDVFAKA
ncbi:hypothetical protein [uncultured Dokdonia sp.]|nr:hypothetical protein [uncultured Dokdonia sp.]